MDHRTRNALQTSRAVNRSARTYQAKPTSRSATSSPLDMGALGGSFSYSWSGSENYFGSKAELPGVSGLSSSVTVARVPASRHTGVDLGSRANQGRSQALTSRFLTNHAIPPRQAEKVLPVYSAYKVLDAKQLSNDYHTQCLSYGRRLLATAIGQQVLLFNPDDLASYGLCTLDWHGSHSRTPTAVFVSHSSDNVVFAGDAEGGVSVLTLPEGTSAMTCLTNHQDRSHPAAALCLTSSAHQPHVFMGGFGDGSVNIYDTRRANLLVSRTLIPSPQPLVGVSRKVISMDTNCTGGLLAVGTSHGAVQVYPLGMSLHQPVLEYVYPEWSAAKAIAFHPHLPHELTVGGGMGDGAIRTMDVHLGQLTAMVKTRSQVTQVAYSTDGSHLVSTHGFEVKAQTKPALSARSHHRSSTADHSNEATYEDASYGSLSSPIDMMPQEVRAGSTASHHQTGTRHLYRPMEVVCPILANSVCVWSRGKGSDAASSISVGDDASPLTHASRTTLRRVHSAYALGHEGHDEFDTPHITATASLRQLSAASASVSSSLMGHSHNLRADVELDASKHWRKEVCLTQHSERPLFLSGCRAVTGQQAGVFATAAGGEDSSIRLWRFLSPPSEVAPHRADRTASTLSSRSSSVASIGFDDDCDNCLR